MRGFVDEPDLVYGVLAALTLSSKNEVSGKVRDHVSHEESLSPWLLESGRRVLPLVKLVWKGCLCLMESDVFDLVHFCQCCSSALTWRRVYETQPPLSRC
jgi:hypothetical protein